MIERPTLFLSIKMELDVFDLEAFKNIKSNQSLILLYSKDTMVKTIA